jgi:hypothetical protein
MDPNYSIERRRRVLSVKNPAAFELCVACGHLPRKLVSRGEGHIWRKAESWL